MRSLLLCICAGLLLQCGSGNKNEFGTVKFMVGDAKRYDAAAGKWKVLEPDETVMLGDSIRTGTEARVEIGFGKNMVSVGENTKIGVYQTVEEEKDKLMVFNVFGTVVADIKKLTGGRDAFEVKTPTSVAAIRGTHFCVVFHLHLGYTDVSVLGGKVWVFNPFLRKSVVVLPGFFTTVYLKRAPLVPKHFNYGQWKKFAPHLHPKMRAKYKKKYKIKTPLMKKLFKGNKGPKGMKKGGLKRKGKSKAGKKGPLKGIFSGKKKKPAKKAVVKKKKGGGKEKKGGGRKK